MGTHAELTDEGEREKRGELSVRHFPLSRMQDDSESYDMISTVVLVKAESPSIHALMRTRSQ